MLRTRSWQRAVWGVALAGALALSQDVHADMAEGIAQPATGISTEIVVSALDNEKFLPAAAYNSIHHEYLVVWHNKWGGGNRDIYAQRVSATGELGDSFAVAASANSRVQAGVAYDPLRDRYLVVWAYDVFGDGSDWDIVGRFIPWNGPDNALGEFIICDWTSSQWNPEVVYAQIQDEFLVVWTNTPSSVQPYISARRVFAGGDGFPDTKGGFTIASNATEPRVHPDVAYNPARNEYVVVYDNALDVFGVRLTGGGVILGGGEYPIAGWPDAEDEPAVAACAGNGQYLVVWQSATADLHEIYGYFLNGDGVPTTVQHVFGTTVDETSPEVVCDATGLNYLVVWEQQFSSPTGPIGLSGRRLHTNGAMELVFGICSPSLAAKDRTNPVVVAGKVNSLAVWEHQRDGASFQDVHARLIYIERLYLPALER